MTCECSVTYAQIGVQMHKQQRLYFEEITYSSKICILKNLFISQLSYFLSDTHQKFSVNPSIPGHTFYITQIRREEKLISCSENRYLTQYFRYQFREMPGFTIISQAAAKEISGLITDDSFSPFYLIQVVLNECYYHLISTQWPEIPISNLSMSRCL